MRVIKITKCTAYDKRAEQCYWYKDFVGETVKVEEFPDWGSGRFFYCPKYEGLILKSDTIRE